MENSKKGNLPLHHGIKISKDLCPKTDEELDRMSRVPYASAIGSIHDVNEYTRLDVSFCLVEAMVTSISKILAKVRAIRELEVCMSLADLGGSINPMPLFVYQKLKLGKLKPTRMSLELANRSVTYTVGIVEDVFVQVGKFTFLADFIIVDYNVDPRVPLILGRPFLMTAKALVDVHGEELTLRIGDEKLTFNVENASNYPHEHDDESINKIDIC
ncbi:reverse transcriptase domain-containing protein [Tanacetum coccineum]